MDEIGMREAAGKSKKMRLDRQGGKTERAQTPVFKLLIANGTGTDLRVGTEPG